MKHEVKGFNQKIADLILDYRFRDIRLEEYQRLSQSGLEAIRDAMVANKVFSETIADRIKELGKVIMVLSTCGALRNITPKVILSEGVQGRSIASGPSISEELSL